MDDIFSIFDNIGIGSTDYSYIRQFIDFFIQGLNAILRLFGKDEIVIAD